MKHRRCRNCKYYKDWMCSAPIPLSVGTTSIEQPTHPDRVAEQCQCFSARTEVRLDLRLFKDVK